MSRTLHITSFRAWISLIVLPWSLLLLCGATCDMTTVNTLELDPTDQATVNTLVDDISDEFYCNGLQPYGTFEGLDPGEAKVGYYRDHDTGDDPAPCWWWVSSVDRGLVKFDVTSLGATADQITGATLEFNLSTTFNEPGLVDPCPDDILASVWIMNEPWSNNFNPSAEFLIDSARLPSCTPSHHTVSVSAIVRDWISGARQNNGFLFVGGNENLPANGSGEHTTTLTSVKLKVLVAVPQGM